VGRAGREGVAITLAEPRERHLLQQIERTTGRRFTAGSIPSKADIRAKRMERFRDTILDTLAAGGLEEYRATIDLLATKLDSKDIAAAALSMLIKATQAPDDEPDIAPQAPQRDSYQQRRSGGPNGGPGNGPGGPGGGNRSGGHGGNRNHSERDGRTRGTMARIWIGAGKQSGVGRRELMDVFENEVGLSARDLGSIDVMDRFCVVDVPGEVSDFVVSTLNGMRFNGKPVPVRLDRAGVVA
jgi:ATP-dependent RNA helicase DeaD